jgi:hypothetical protein
MGLSYFFNDFYKDCSAIPVGLSEIDYKLKMSKYINDKQYNFDEDAVYAKIFKHEKAISIGVQKWYSIDYWRCIALIDNGKVSDMHLDFH